jgi:bacillolysin
MPRTIVGAACVLSLVAAAVTSPRAQSRVRSFSVSDASTPSDVRSSRSAVDAMFSAGGVALVHEEQDPLLAHRRHERLRQLHRGVPVWGADLTRQMEDGRLISLFGEIHDRIGIETTPRVSADAAKTIVEGLAGAETGRTPELVVVPLDAGGYRLAWSLHVLNAEMRRMRYFVDALTGELIFSLDQTTTQSAVGTGLGVNGDRKKVSAESVTGGFQTNDRLRPPALRTFDMRGDPLPVVQFLNGQRPLFTTDIARDSDNDWQDGPVVDAHVHAGLTYDYYFKVHGRRGLNNADSRILSVVHPVRRENILQYTPSIQNAFFLNAGYYGEGVMVYGVGIPAHLRLGGQWVDHLAGALDIVAHELTHGVTEFSSDLIYRNESGALNESFSDMMGAAAEFAYQPRGTGRGQADYLIGEDAFIPGGLRSMSNPGAHGDPDHYSLRYTGTLDNGGVHINSGIPNQVFYLAIEGGTNATSGLSVQGVGFANREQIEKAMYRAFVFMLPANATFATARAATIQAARDLHGAGSPAERAIAQAWTAVGVD